ncbi:MAG: IS91 family transposase, partial [bacterium]|nr:IS91 family transposase [bacterium]
MTVVAHDRAASADVSRVELADVFARHAEAYLGTHYATSIQRKVVRAIIACRTPALGGHREWCPRCGYERYLYHSCRNRHCPKCQSLAKAGWVADRQRELLPVPYFHQVFTLPHEINSLILWNEENQRALLDLLFQAASRTLLEFGKNNLGGKVGFTILLHTWDQQLRPHFHLHVLMASGALADGGKRWVAGGSKFLFPVRALSKVFRAKYLDGLARLIERNLIQMPPHLKGAAGSALPWGWLRRLRRKPWVVYSKPPFSGPRKLLDYLGRYTHRVAISNHRIVSCDHQGVCFTYRDRDDGNRRKYKRLEAVEFIQRFLTHVLPSGFSRIRHYGFLANRIKHRSLQQCRILLGAAPVIAEPEPPRTVADWMQRLLGLDINCCPKCRGPLHRESLPRVQHPRVQPPAPN